MTFRRLAKQAFEEASEPVSATPSHPINEAKKGNRTPLPDPPVFRRRKNGIL